MEDVIESIFSDLKKQSLTDFEMVFVNDGGGEKMSTILDAFAGKDDRVIKVEKSNGGISSAPVFVIGTPKFQDWVAISIKS